MLTNCEVHLMFEVMIEGWLSDSTPAYNDFVKALLMDDVDYMNQFMNQIALRTFSSFDTGRNVSVQEPERFYHGFVLGLIVSLAGKYHITSNRESGFGRYDIMLEPVDGELPAVIMEFKVFNRRKEKNLEETVENALLQIKDRKYDTELEEKGILKERIRHYGFAFEGKKVLIGKEFSY